MYLGGDVNGVVKLSHLEVKVGSVAVFYIDGVGQFLKTNIFTDFRKSYQNL